MPLLDVIILTFNEEDNLPFTLQSLVGLDCNVHIVDSGSTDRTREIASDWGAQVVIHTFENQARQLNWALDNLKLSAPWVLRLDADEWLTKELKDEIAGCLPLTSTEVAGYMLRRRLYFWGKWIRHGGYYPVWILRLWRSGQGRSEDVWMDEHMIVTGGRIDRLRHDFADENRRGVGFFVDKHNSYADREILKLQERTATREGEGGEAHASRKHFLKNNLYDRCPLFLRAAAYWVLRYFILLGFLDGKAGFVFHFLQAFWYRTLIDAKLFEYRRRVQSREE